MSAINKDNLIEKNKPAVTIQGDDLEKLVRNNITKVLQNFKNKELRDLENKFDERIESKETKTTEILAIFITLFTFISVNVNIFTRVADVYTAVWFMLIMTLSSVILLLALFWAINSKNDWKIWVGLLVVLAFITFLISVVFPSNWNPKLNPVVEDNQTEVRSI